MEKVHDTLLPGGFQPSPAAEASLHRVPLPHAEPAGGVAPAASIRTHATDGAGTGSLSGSARAGGSTCGIGNRGRRWKRNPRRVVWPSEISAVLVVSGLMLGALVVLAALCLAAVVELVGRIATGLYCHACGRLVRLWWPRRSFGVHCLRCALGGRHGLRRYL